MLPLWLFNMYMDDVLREVNATKLEKDQELVGANVGRFEINQLLFGDDKTASGLFRAFA